MIKWDLVKFVMCTLDSWVHMTFYILRKGYTVPGNQGTHDKLDLKKTGFYRRKTLPLDKFLVHGLRA